MKKKNKVGSGIFFLWMFVVCMRKMTDVMRQRVFFFFMEWEIRINKPIHTRTYLLTSCTIYHLVVFSASAFDVIIWSFLVSSIQLLFQFIFFCIFLLQQKCWFQCQIKSFFFFFFELTTNWIFKTFAFCLPNCLFGGS